MMINIKFLSFSGLILLIFLNLTAQPKRSKNPFVNYDPEYTKVITGRSDKIVKTLGIDDTSKYNRVISIIVEQYRNLSALHDFKDFQIKRAKSLEGAEKEMTIKIAKDSANAQLYYLHAHFIASLSSELSAEQIEKVKDGMTYGRMMRDYNAFIEMIPSLTKDEKRYIYSAHYEARELAMDQGSSKAKHRIFDKYRGRVNNYLSACGYDLKEERRKWEERKTKEK
jgi:hypothetical protein